MPPPSLTQSQTSYDRPRTEQMMHRRQFKIPAPKTTEEGDELCRGIPDFRDLLTAMPQQPRGERWSPPGRTLTDCMHCVSSAQARCFVLFSVRSSGYQLGCTEDWSQLRTMLPKSSSQPLLA